MRSRASLKGASSGRKRQSILIIMNVHDLAAALIAGGASSRMGRDKALLPVVWHEQQVPLWRRQLSVLESLHPDELIFSGPARGDMPNSLVVLADRIAGKGPLGGIATCLGHIESNWLVVVAVDLPRIDTDFFRELLRQRQDTGVVPVRNGKFEPLAAVYPKSASAVANKRLECGDLKLQAFVAELIQLGLVRPWDVPEDMESRLINWNLPRVM
jgi:molybdopterin-guanine dinucleotide biosynthesis protein A